MIKQNDIITAINIVLVASYPDYKVYVQRCPKDFKRPSFLLENVRTSRRDINRTTVEKTVYFKITCFINVDEYYRSDTDALSEIQEAVMQLFSVGHVIVGDRAIKVQSSTGGNEYDRAYVDLQFEYFDNRTDAADTMPLVASVKTNLEEV